MRESIRIGLVFDANMAYARGVLRGVKRFAQTRPRWTLVVHDAEGLKPHTLEVIRPSGMIAGVVSEPMARVLAAPALPVINVSAVLPDAPFPRVIVNHRQVGRLAFAHLQGTGLRHFGFVGHSRHYYSAEREAGYRAAMSPGEHTYSAFYERPWISFRHRARLLALDPRLQRWLRALPKPVGIFACHDVWGVQVIEACRLTGFRVPDEVAVIGVDNDDLLCELARPSLSSVIVPAESIGYSAAALLDRLLRGARPPQRARLIATPGIITRQSSNVLAVDDANLTAAVRFIRDRSHQPVHVNDVLKAVPASRRALEQKFRSVLQRGIAEEIRRVHLDRAKELLATTTLSIGEVAVQSGFSSVYHLSRLFRRSTGATPSEFRHRLQGRQRPWRLP
jgi:LacI family transcriptional regulator